MKDEIETDYQFDQEDRSQIERFVGIDQYSTPKNIKLGGIYKHHYRDFVVREILNDGLILNPNDDAIITRYSEHRDQFTSFNLTKVNMDTFKAVSLISKALKVPQHIIDYHGLKDKTAITVQRMTIRGNYISQLKELDIDDLFIRNIAPTNLQARIGGNSGNQFTIIIRNIEERESLKSEADLLINELNERGFPNYFGLQRFGTFRPNSHVVGKRLLEGKFKEAFDEFVLKTYSLESERSRTVRQTLKETGDLERAIQEFPKSLRYERIMIDHLIKHPGDYRGAMITLPRDLINLVISAYQSYLFNKCVSFRAKKGFSLHTPVNGDVIALLEEERGPITRVKHVYGAHEGFFDKYLEEAIKLEKAVIVAPIIGHDTDLDEFPLVKSLSKELMEDEGISIEMFKNSDFNQHDFSGSFRAIATKPIGLKILELNNDEVFKCKKKLKIEFSLIKGSYATMLLRELIKP